MFGWLSANIGTLIITLLLIGIVTTAVMVLRSDKKKGKSTCGGNCGHCPMGCSCNHNQ